MIKWMDDQTNWFITDWVEFSNWFEPTCQSHKELSRVRSGLRIKWVAALVQKLLNHLMVWSLSVKWKPLSSVPYNAAKTCYLTDSMRRSVKVSVVWGTSYSLKDKYTIWQIYDLAWPISLRVFHTNHREVSYINMRQLSHVAKSCSCHIKPKRHVWKCSV